MTRNILSAVAAAAMLAMSTAPGASQAELSGQQPVPCDCTNCSAEHCPKPGGPMESLSLNFVQITYLRMTWERHLSTGARSAPPADCPRLHPIATCRASWE